MTHAAALAAALVLGGCSFVFVRGPGDPLPEQRPRCTSAPVAPALDTVLVAAFAFASYTAHRRMADAKEGDDDLNSEFLRFQRDWALVAALFEAGAATYGYVRTARCRSAKAQFDAAHAR